MVAINAHPTDTTAEVEVVREAALRAGATAAVRATHFVEGGAGAEELARAVLDALELPSSYRPLYPSELGLSEKIETIAREIYGADGIELLPAAARELKEIERLGFGQLPVCIAKTHLSLSHDPRLVGCPRGFRLPVREARLYAGAGFVTAVAGDIRLLPGLPSRPAGEQIDIDENGNVVGLF